MKTNKTILRWFADFDKEEEWLNHMSGNGWCLWHTNGYLYRFKKSEPGEFIFQIDFDEDWVNDGREDYVNFRSSCGDIFVHEIDSRIYWKRKASDGPFENGGNEVAKLKIANKAFSLWYNKLTSLLYGGAIGVVLLLIFRLLPECRFTKLMVGICRDVPVAFAIVIVLFVFPIVMKLRRKIDVLIRKMTE